MPAYRSGDEGEIRAYVVDRLRGYFPNARIVHELNIAGTGSQRIDVAAISPSTIVGVEIKSKKDTLKRLGEQFPAFQKCCHFVFVAAHDKHFKEHPHTRDLPKSSDILGMLWAEELRAECAHHGIKANSRSNRPDMICEMSHQMTGAQISKAVCRQLRKREFKEADPIINDPV